jgi:hypothetical protein
VKVMVAGIDPPSPSRGCVGVWSRVRDYRSGLLEDVLCRGRVEKLLHTR